MLEYDITALIRHFLIPIAAVLLHLALEGQQRLIHHLGLGTNDDNVEIGIDKTYKKHSRSHFIALKQRASEQDLFFFFLVH